MIREQKAEIKQRPQTNETKNIISTFHTAKVSLSEFKTQHFYGHVTYTMHFFNLRAAVILHYAWLPLKAQCCCLPLSSKAIKMHKNSISAIFVRGKRQKCIKWYEGDLMSTAVVVVKYIWHDWLMMISS